jgi:nitroreductase
MVQTGQFPWDLEAKVMEIMEIIRGRRSIRAFDPEQDVSAEVVDRLLEAAIWAPSAGNVEPWRFVVVRDEGIRRSLAAAAFGQSFVAAAPVVIVVAVNTQEAMDSYRGRGRDLYAIQDTAAAIQNILLVAHSMGYGTCWVGAFDEQAAAEALGLEAELRPVALIPVGVALEKPTPPPRRPLREVVRGA